jgi:CheY-like chemotaxis protein
MANNGIWMVDDDVEDQDLIRDICKDLRIDNHLEFFGGGDSFLQKLDAVSEAPFLILSDINLRGMSGFELRKKMLEAPEKKFHSVPFIFWSGTASEAQVEKAYRLRAHGFFIKQPRYSEWKETLTYIVQYWRKCKMPSKREGFDDPLK